MAGAVFFLRPWEKNPALIMAKNFAFAAILWFYFTSCIRKSAVVCIFTSPSSNQLNAGWSDSDCSIVV